MILIIIIIMLVDCVFSFLFYWCRRQHHVRDHQCSATEQISYRRLPFAEISSTDANNKYSHTFTTPAGARYQDLLYGVAAERQVPARARARRSAAAAGSDVTGITWCDGLLLGTASKSASF